MKKFFSCFAEDENGAVTVDFVVLTAAICLLGILVVFTFSDDTTDLANDIESFLDNIEIEEG